MNDEELNKAYRHEVARLRRAIEQLEQTPLWRVLRRRKLRRAFSMPKFGDVRKVRPTPEQLTRAAELAPRLEDVVGDVFCEALVSQGDAS